MRRKSTIKIRNEILERFNKIRERIVQAIHDGDWSAVAWNVAIVLAIVAVALGRGRSGLAWKVLGTLLGKIFAVPLVLFILVLSYKMNLENSRAAYCVKSEFAMLDEWARICSRCHVFSIPGGIGVHQPHYTAQGQCH